MECLNSRINQAFSFLDNQEISKFSLLLATLWLWPMATEYTTTTKPYDDVVMTGCV